MKKYTHYLLFLFAFSSAVMAQEGKESPKQKEQGHSDINKFRQNYDLMATPNMYRTASGAPGPEYYQQQADYKMDVELDDKNKKLMGTETITYTNNAKESLDYLWVQLDQNQIAKTSKSPLVESTQADASISARGFSRKYLEEKFSSLDKYQEDISDIKVELIRDQHHNKGEVFTVEVHVSFAHQKPIMARETNIDARAAVDLAESKLARQIIKNKEKYSTKVRRGSKIIKSLKFWRKE